MVERIWESSSVLPPLAEEQVSVFHFSLDFPDEEIAGLLAVLDAVERKRAARFKRVLHQKRFAAGRAVLRTILGYYMGQSAASIAFCYGAQGKPALDSSDSLRSLQFNLSHSGGDALCAVAWDHPVGVDIEAWKEGMSVLRIADRFFSPEESRYLSTCNTAQRASVFYGLWTAKEALLKGAGGGLTIPLDRCCFALGQEPLGLRLVDLPVLARANWAVYSVPEIAGFSGALAIAGRREGPLPRYYRCDSLLLQA